MELVNNEQIKSINDLKIQIIMNRSRCNGYDSMGREFIEELEKEYLEVKNETD